MALIVGSPGDEPGDRVVFDAMRSLPGDCFVYAQPKLVFRDKVRYPDYVVISQEWGVLVLEVKDWIDIEARDREDAYRGSRGSTELRKETSPVEQARQAAFVLKDMLEDNAELCNYAGKLDFSYAYAGILPDLPPSRIAWLAKEWGQGCVLGREDIAPDQIAARLSKVPRPFCVRLTEGQVSAVRAVIDPSNVCRDYKTGIFKGVYDREQEMLAKEPLASATPLTSRSADTPPATQDALDLQLSPSQEARVKHLETEVPQEALDAKNAAHIRLVRGVAGSGKTDVLILRVHFLHSRYPDAKILVTTFNDPLYRERLQPELAGLQPAVHVQKFESMCAALFEERNHSWREPQDTHGLVQGRLAAENPDVERFGTRFLADEFIWMKETGRTERETYVDGVREGRGGGPGRTLSRAQKAMVFDLFTAYQQALTELPNNDWVDLHSKVLGYIARGEVRPPQFDVILIDEGQHFAPQWMAVVNRLLKPGGNLFICDDPSQSVYRYYSWRQKGVEVSGHTRWLRVPYRNTRQIAAAAYALVEGNELASSLLAETGETVRPALDDSKMRDGPRPQLHRFGSTAAEKEFVKNEVAELIRNGGVFPSEIAILHEHKYVRDRYQAYADNGVHVEELKKQTGLEYKVVFIPALQELESRAGGGTSIQDDEARLLLKFYMAMTRARDRLYLMYEQRCPRVLDQLGTEVERFHH